MPFYVRLMEKEDIVQVAEIEREAFPYEWPPTNFDYELKNRIAHYIVACDKEKTAEPVEFDTGLASRIKRIFGHDHRSLSTSQYIVGFAGIWIMADEAHLTSIAVHQPYRRLGIGELLLVSTMDFAKELKASFITLEARVSNNVAQNLYTKYGFRKIGVRRGYYSNNREDAVLMSTENIAEVSSRPYFQQLKHDLFRKLGSPVTDSYLTQPSRH